MKLFKQPIRFLSIFALVLSAVLLGNGGTAAAANPLLCFAGGNGTCTLNAAGTGATLITTDNDTDPNNADAGVYYAVSSLSGLLIGDVTNVSFTYSCADTTGATNCVTGGSPRVSIPIDTNNDGDTESFAFIDANNCGQTGHATGTVDLSCPVFFGGTLYTDWAAFVTANPTYRVATDDLSFVIVDQPFRGSVSNVQLGRNVATAKDECKKGGWADMTRADGTTFKNQGDCIQYVNTGK